MKITKRSIAFGSLSSLISRTLITLVVCLMLLEVKPIAGRPRSSVTKNSLDFFQRDARLAKASKSDKSAKSKSIRAPYLRLREVPQPEVIVTEGSAHVLACEAGGTPTPTIHWLKNGQKISQGEVSHFNDDDIQKGDLSLSLTRSRLYLDCVQAKDEAVYTCVASTPTKRISAETHLKVIPNRTANDMTSDNSVARCLAKKSYGSPARIHMWTHNILELIGSDVQLLCRSSGVPAPTVSWIGPEENTLTNSERYKVLENGDLVIKDLSWDDMGNYMCIAQNQLGSDRTTLFLYPTLPEDRK